MRILKEECLGQDGKAIQRGRHAPSPRGRGCTGMSSQTVGNRVLSPREKHAQDIQDCMSLEDA